jgi:hypothetical protein
VHSSLHDSRRERRSDGERRAKAKGVRRQNITNVSESLKLANVGGNVGTLKSHEYQSIS